MVGRSARFIGLHEQSQQLTAGFQPGVQLLFVVRPVAGVKRAQAGLFINEVKWLRGLPA